MAHPIQKSLCLVLVIAALTGLFAGCHRSQPTTEPIITTLNSTNTTTPATSAPDTVPTTSATAPEPTQPTTVPESTEPDVSQVTIPAIRAKNAFVYDTRGQQFLYASCDTTAALYPASITKLFTTYVALKHLQINDRITVGSELRNVASDASVAGFHKGDVVSVEALVYGALLPSGCDASYILAAAAGRVILKDPDASAADAIGAFMRECNLQAALLQIPNTFLANPDGYHKSSHYISLEGFAIIGMLALENEHIARIVATPTATITYTNAQGKTCTATFHNSNKTLHTGDQAYYHPLSVGLKTGTTNEAGACLLAAYKADGGYILVGVFGGSSYNARFTDANALFEAFYPYL